mgnify:CR=1 FL=1
MALYTNLANLANDIFVNELDSTGASLSSVSGWLNENLGMLNTYIYTSFSGSNNGDVSGMGLEEQDIYKEMYLYHHRAFELAKICFNYFFFRLVN